MEQTNERELTICSNCKYVCNADEKIHMKKWKNELWCLRCWLHDCGMTYASYFN